MANTMFSLSIFLPHSYEKATAQDAESTCVLTKSNH